ncbi:MAG TPA: lysine--tRNA ligase [Conexibacter sp.]|nr:lysine--tRNA ligase [Conexibacter sp.]
MAESVPARPVREFSEVQDRRAKMERFRAEGIDPYPRAFEGMTEIAAVQLAHNPAALEPGEHPAWSYRVAGRLIARRGHGKTTFLELRERSGSMQLYLQEDALGEEAYRRALDLDIGDVVGGEGSVYVTKRGQLALAATQVTLLAKALRPPPDKHHGLDDPQTRFRNRELDLIANASTRELFVARARMVSAIRAWFDTRGFIEIESPALGYVRGGAAARPFVAHHHALDSDVYLRISTELYLKRCLIGGLERVYELGKAFRNEGISPKHSPEFTLLEWIQTYTGYLDIAVQIEELLAAVALRTLGTTRIQRDGQTFDLAEPWRRVTMREAILEATGVDVASADHAALAALVGEGIPADASWSWLVTTIYEKRVEPFIVAPTMVFDFPAEQLPLTRPQAEHPEYAEWFDAIIGGIEVAAGATELNDPDVQRARFVDQHARLRAGEDAAHPPDEEFVRALQYGMPPAAGGAIGVDRLLMVLTGVATLREALPFPALRER